MPSGSVVSPRPAGPIALTVLALLGFRRSGGLPRLSEGRFRIDAAAAQ